MPEQAVIYCRVSSAEQVDNTSLATQEAACREWCARNGLEVAGVYTDAGESAKTANRPQFLAAVERCLRDRAVVRLVVYRTDRFARSMFDHAVYRRKLREAGTDLASVSEQFDDGPAGNMMENIVASFSEYDNAVRAARAKDAMRSIRARGGWCNRIPYGFRIERVDGVPVLMPDPSLQPLVREAFRMVAAGHPKTLVYEHLKPGVGISTFYRLFTELRYAPLDPEGWAAVQRAMSSPRPRTKRVGEFPLKGVLLCGDCGKPLTASWSRGNSMRYCYYHCRTAGHTSRIGAMKVNDAVVALLAEISAQSQKFMPFIRELVLAANLNQTADVLASKGRIEADIADYSARMDRLVDLRLKGGVDEPMYRRKHGEISGRLAELRDQLAQSDRIVENCEKVMEIAPKYIAELVGIWNEAEPGQRPRLLGALFPRGIVIQGGKVRTSASASIFGPVLDPEWSKSGMAPLRAVVSNMNRLAMAVCGVAA